MLKGPLCTDPVQEEFGVQPPRERGVPSPGSPVWWVLMGCWGPLPWGPCCGVGNAARSQRLPLLPSSALHGFAVFSPD